jgi:hypothetical protein
MQTQNLFLSSQEIDTGSYTGTGEYSSHCLFAINFNISFHFHLGLVVDSSYQVF